jgi:CTP:molybdopterin cytidylyltransferase MocA
VLAAGGGSRFQASGGGAHKLVAPWRGRPLATWAVEAALASGVARTWVVTGAVDLRGLLPVEAELIDNQRWSDGQASSLAVGVAAAAASDVDAVVVGLADQPLIPASAWRAVALATSALAVATYDGRRRNPVRLARCIWPLLPDRGDEGARVLMRDQPQLVQEVPCEGEPADIDTTEDLRTWN